jgi:hypothetical protein
MKLFQINQKKLCLVIWIKNYKLIIIPMVCI